MAERPVIGIGARVRPQLFTLHASDFGGKQQTGVTSRMTRGCNGMQHLIRPPLLTRLWFAQCTDADWTKF